MKRRSHAFSAQAVQVGDTLAADSQSAAHAARVSDPEPNAPGPHGEDAQDENDSIGLEQVVHQPVGPTRRLWTNPSYADDVHNRASDAVRPCGVSRELRERPADPRSSREEGHPVTAVTASRR